MPGTVRVKLSSEEAAAVSITPVVVREMPVRDLIGLMLDYTRKDTRRIQSILGRGTLVSGATRYRWEGWQASSETVQAILASFPDPEPARPFVPDLCVRVVLRGSGLRLGVPREALSGRGLFRRRSFWDVLAEVAAAGVEYAGYSYGEQADRFLLKIPPSGRECLKENAALLRFPKLEVQIRSGAFDVVEFFVRRSG
ncbi:MAG TPA: hypothetical protein VLH09_03095 [Bryobacteraceae bacterium]|nr:hypothetical protein [Bryobacteraceae bacterium]